MQSSAGIYPKIFGSPEPLKCRIFWTIQRISSGHYERTRFQKVWESRSFIRSEKKKEKDGAGKLSKGNCKNAEIHDSEFKCLPPVDNTKTWSSFILDPPANEQVLRNVQLFRSEFSLLGQPLVKFFSKNYLVVVR